MVAVPVTSSSSADLACCGGNCSNGDAGVERAGRGTMLTVYDGQNFKGWCNQEV